MIAIGIDPGKSGALAVLHDDYIKAQVFDIQEYSKILHNIRGADDTVKCIVEKVGARPGQGVTSMFHFGENFGMIQGLLIAYGIPFELVTPQKWKKEYSVTKDKNTSIEVCRRLFPAADLKASARCRKDHDGMAEAILMAEYARRHM